MPNSIFGVFSNIEAQPDIMFIVKTSMKTRFTQTGREWGTVIQDPYKYLDIK